MGNPQVTEFEIGWLVGIFDGEGCYLIAKSKCREGFKYAASIKFVNTNLHIIEEVHRILTALDIGHYIYNSWRAKNQRPGKRLEIIGLLRVKKFLDFFLPRMYCRSEQATVLKQFVELRLSKPHQAPYEAEEDSLYRILKGFNERGSGTSETTRDQSFFEGL